jgi:hypothetical protein
VLSVFQLDAERAQVTEVCVDENTCIDQLELLELLEQVGVPATTTGTSVPDSDVVIPPPPATTSTSSTEVALDEVATSTDIEISEETATSSEQTAETEEVSPADTGGQITEFDSITEDTGTPVIEDSESASSSTQNSLENNDGIP